MSISPSGRTAIPAGLALLFALLPSFAPSVVVAQDRPLAILGATVIDGTERPPILDGVVLLRRGRIVAVGSRSDVQVSRGAEVVDGRGRWVLPGFVDMHSHLAIGAWEADTAGGRRGGLKYSYDDAAARELSSAQWRFGITTIRNPAGPTSDAVRLRTRVALGEVAGPRIYTAGAPLDAYSQGNAQVAVTTDSAVEAEVARQAAAGVDMIKLYAGLRLPMTRAGVGAAHRLGLPVVLHAWMTSWTDAARAGVDAITHISPGSPDLLPPSRRAEFRSGMRGTQFMFDWFRYVDTSGSEMREMLDALRRNGVTVDPTLVAMEQMAWADDSAHYPPVARVLIPASLKEKPAPERVLTAGWSPADFARVRETWPSILAFTRLLYQSGVMLTVGTDGANPWYYHRELELLVAAGIPTAEVLRMATRNAARALRRASEFGTIEAGKAADLVILDADPLSDIRNTRRVVATIQGGIMRTVR